MNLWTSTRFGAVAALGGLLILTVLNTPAQADVVLTYTGHNFTTFHSPYSGTDSITAEIILADPLGDSLKLTDVTPISFSISDGVQTVKNARESTFAFGTDAAGTIDEWNILIQPTEALNQIQSFDENPVGAFDQVCCFFEGTQLVPFAANSNDPGAWQVAPAPELSNVAAFRILILVFLWQRRRQVLNLFQFRFR